jgi:hypothetical protein
MGLSPSVKQILGEIDNAAEALENKLNCNVLLLAFHNYAYIQKDVMDDLENFLISTNKKYEDRDLCLILHTLGGDADVAYHIGVRLQNLAGEKRLLVIIPRMAKSAGTLLACAGDVIYMTPMAELGPVDPQVTVSDTLWVSAKSIGDSLRMVLEIIIEVLQSKKPAGEIQEMLIRATLSQMPMNAVSHYDSLLAHVEELLEDLLSRRMLKEDKEIVSSVAQKLTRGYKFHGRVIHLDEARKIGLRVESLAGEHLSAVYAVYNRLRDLFTFIDKSLTPIPDILRIISVTSYNLNHGLVYVPEIPPMADYLTSPISATTTPSPSS